MGIARDGTDVDPNQGNSDDGQEMTLAGAERKETLNVDGRDVIIEGSGNHFTLLGCPKSVTVAGAQNKVEIEETASIVINGVENVITYKSGRPTVDNNGPSNTITGP
jgi:hypothetical protein